MFNFFFLSEPIHPKLIDVKCIILKKTLVGENKEFLDYLAKMIFFPHFSKVPFPKLADLISTIKE